MTFLKYITQRKKMSSLCLCYSRYISFFLLLLYFVQTRALGYPSKGSHRTSNGKIKHAGNVTFLEKSGILIFLFFDMVEVTFFLMDNGGQVYIYRKVLYRRGGILSYFFFFFVSHVSKMQKFNCLSLLRAREWTKN